MGLLASTVHVCMEGGRRGVQIPAQPAHELIHLVLSWRSRLWRLPCQLRLAGHADGKLEQVLLLGQERKYSLSPLLSKNMLRAFLRLDAIKNSCGSKHPRSLRLGRLKTKTRSKGRSARVPALSQRWLDRGASGLEWLPRDTKLSLFACPGMDTGHRSHSFLPLLTLIEDEVGVT